MPMTSSGDVTIRPMRESDLDEADRIMRVAFGTFIGLPDPATFLGDGAYVRHRFRADPATGFTAERGGEVLGSNFVARWGSFGYFGPLSIRPDLWDRGLGRLLMEPVMARFEEWRVSLSGLFTFASSPKHLALYHRYGYRPRHLTAIMSGPIDRPAPMLTWSRFSDLEAAERNGVLRATFDVTDALFEGLDVAHEIVTVHAQSLGDTVLVWDGATLVAFASCHVGPGTEAGSGTCYVKFGAVRPGVDAARHFEELVRVCTAFGAEHDTRRLVVGVNTARHEAYEWLLDHGFRTDVLGVALHRPNLPGFSRPGIWVLDDWR
jgi:predicted N-acetyltransferase YhbS